MYGLGLRRRLFGLVLWRMRVLEHEPLPVAVAVAVPIAISESEPIAKSKPIPALLCK